MEYKVLEEKKHRLVFELKGSDHGFCNVLKKELWNDEDISIASYTIDHPLTGIPKFILETKKEDVKAALKKAITRLKKQGEQFKEQVSKIK